MLIYATYPPTSPTCPPTHGFTLPEGISEACRAALPVVRLLLCLPTRVQ